MGNFLREGLYFGRCQPRFVGAAVNIDLQADLKRREARRPLLAQALGDLEPVDRLHPVKMLGDQTGFVALHRAYAMPFKGLAARLAAQRENFLHPLGNVVFAESPLPVRSGVGDGIGTKGFGHGQQPHRGRVTPGGKAGRGDTVTDKLEIAHNRGHNRTVNFS